MPSDDQDDRPRSNSPAAKRRRRLRRLGSEASLYIVRGAASAVGGFLVTWATVWVQNRA
ncbi:hypothetical protein FHX80_12656 [Streptomyces brevispora]|uniref:Uncharacterized protein n=1 Tax=Streptomyces brevispora TaxID=887462 RepID=A0A561TYY7_9ACTN|nr:hypothetical protein FHX80_12656 [Streptomyces brevispora]